MTITLCQLDIQWLNTAANYSKIEEILQKCPESDLLVLPEMCTTGFITLPTSGQLELATEIEKRLLCLAQKYNTAICGSFAVNIVNNQGEGNQNNRNRAYFITPEGKIHAYDKHHLFTPGQEHIGYQSGDHRTIIEWRGVRFMPIICYDLRFPTWNRNLKDSPYDILICVANWPQARQLACDTLLRARAIENQAYCIGVNRVGHDTMCEYQGGTCAIHPYGHAVATCPDNQESYCTFTPDMEKLLSYRQKFPSLQDADNN